jgi:hypothetical protein
MVPRRTPRFAVPSGTRAIVAARVFFIVSSVTRLLRLTCARFFNSPTLFRSGSLTSSVAARLFRATQRKAGGLCSYASF